MGKVAAAPGITRCKRGLAWAARPLLGQSRVMNRIAAIVLASASLLAGCSPGPVELDGGNSGQAVTATVGQEIRVTLGTIGPGNYGDPQISSSAVRFLNMTYPKEQNPGGPTQVFQFEAVSPGRADIRIPHEGGFPVPRAPFTLMVVVH
jgi:hypothetical protein